VTANMEVGKRSPSSQLRIGTSLRAAAAGARRWGEVPEARAALAVRTALSSTVCAAAILAPLPPQLRQVLPLSLAALTIPMVYLCSLPERGDTMKMSMSLILSGLVLNVLGTAFTYLCYVVAGFAWRPWVLVAGVPLLAFLLVIWGKVAELKHAPRAIFVGIPPVLFLICIVPMLMLNHSDIMMPLQATLGSVLAMIGGASMALLATCLPFGLGSPPAKYRVPSLMAAKLSAVADYLEACTLMKGRTTASLSKSRFCRLLALRHSIDLRKARASAAAEHWWRPASQPKVDELSEQLENCRLAVQMKHQMSSAAPSSDMDDLAQRMLCRGKIGEAIFDVSVAASHALRSASSLLADVAGVEPVVEVPGLPEYGSEHADASECRRAALACSQALEAYNLQWQENTRHGTWRDTLQILCGEGDQAKYMQDVAVFKDLARIATDHLAVCRIATTAAATATLAAEAQEQSSFDYVQARDGSSSQPNGVGLLAWLLAPAAGAQTWRTAFKASGRYAFRFSVAMFLSGAWAIACLHWWPGQVEAGLWAACTAGICMLPKQGAAILKGAQRFGGTVIGAGIAVASVYLAQGSALALWLQVPVIVFSLKFFDQELHYLGSTCIVTYSVVMSSSVDTGGIEFSLVAAHRILHICIGILIALLVSIFVAPDRGVDSLRGLEMEALSCMAKAISVVAKALTGAVGTPTTEASESVTNAQTAAAFLDVAETMSEKTDLDLEGLKSELWKCYINLFASANELSGMGDMLSDVRWEARIGTDRGNLFCRGLLWLPRCRRRSAKSPDEQPRLAAGASCLEAAPLVSQVLRITYCLVGLMDSGLESGAERLLQDERAAAVLGRHGEGVSGPVQSTVQALQAHLREASRKAEQGSAKDKAADSADDQIADEAGLPQRSSAKDSLAEAKANLSLLFEGAAASRAAAGGFASPACPDKGGFQVASILFTVDICLKRLDLICDVLQREEE